MFKLFKRKKEDTPKVPTSRRIFGKNGEIVIEIAPGRYTKERGGEIETIIDWKARKVPKVWRVYRATKEICVDKNGKRVVLNRHLPVNDFETYEEALEVATTLAKKVNE